MSWHTRENFGRLRPEVATVRRAELAAHAAKVAGSQATAPRRQQPDPAAVAEIQRRFEICKACEHLRDDGFACALHSACCFGRFRSDLANRCPAGRW